MYIKIYLVSFMDIRDTKLDYSSQTLHIEYQQIIRSIWVKGHSSETDGSSRDKMVVLRYD